jgi:hypothetical protein
MVHNKSLDPYKQIIAALLSDAQVSHSEVFTLRSLRLTTLKVTKRIDQEGIGFLTKALPRLGKSLDKALSGAYKLDSTGFQKEDGSQLPRFLGELFKLVFHSDGWILPSPCVKCIDTLRQILFVYYKLDWPYAESQEQDVIDRFVKTEDDIYPYDDLFSKVADQIVYNDLTILDRVKPTEAGVIIRKARVLLSRVFSSFDPYDIVPGHGPGAVSTREKLWGKYHFERINPRIDAHFPFDAYFRASLGHVCDSLKDLSGLVSCESSARVILVPKDSRGPRLISCEPLEFQWIQQGLSRAIVKLIEHHPLTRYNVHFTDQGPNQFGALLGSSSGKYATLDLKDASDRVTCGLVRLLFPQHISDVLMAARSDSTILPSGSKLKLRKFAPMGSALCFPVMALTIWALLTAVEVDADTRKSILVYGDDVIVTTESSVRAMNTLESFGLLINRDKSCFQGLFRESCGVDAFNGKDITPVRLRTRWSSRPSPDVYESYIAYSNAFFRLQYYHTSELITGWLHSIYGVIPPTYMHIACPSLDNAYSVPCDIRTRTNPDLQKIEYLVRCSVTRPIRKEIDGWSMLLRYFSESHGSSAPFPNRLSVPRRSEVGQRHGPFEPSDAPSFRVRSYTRRQTSFLDWRWR